jgi:4-diphosphocytidyl-2-C-methyl-D-erythritol kinase
MSGANCWPAPAKINLFLHITGRRADGYHLLQTVFQFLDYGDALTFDVRRDGVVSRLTEIAGVPAESDLTVRAARQLQAFTGTSLGVDIGIEKRLPMGGGLGGGSSDAATTLVALNHLWRLGLSEDELAGIGLKLGADVPVFVRGRAAWAEGVGEQLTPLELPEPWFLVIIPPCHVPTAELFAAPELTRNVQSSKIPAFLSGQWSEQWGNVFEPVVRQRYPDVDNALKWLAKFAPARMSGSGACLFAPFESEAQARRVMAQMPPGWRGFVAKGVNHSPLYARLAAG